MTARWGYLAFVALLDRKHTLPRLRARTPISHPMPYLFQSVVVCSFSSFRFLLVFAFVFCISKTITLFVFLFSSLHFYLSLVEPDHPLSFLKISNFVEGGWSGSTAEDKRIFGGRKTVVNVDG